MVYNSGLHEDQGRVVDGFLLKDLINTNPDFGCLVPTIWIVNLLFVSALAIYYGSKE